MPRPVPPILLAALTVCAAGAAGAVEFGRLFHSVEEREQLDRLRRGEPVGTASLPERPVVPPELTGYVKRSDGRNTVWLDGVPVPTNSPKAVPMLDPRKVRDDARLPESAIRATSPK